MQEELKELKYTYSPLCHCYPVYKSLSSHLFHEALRLTEAQKVGCGLLWIASLIYRARPQ